MIAGFSLLDAAAGNLLALFAAFLHERVRLWKALLRLRAESPA